MDPFYLPADQYYVDDSEADAYPVRQGDVLVAPDPSLLGSRKAWIACQVVHPSCEIISKREPDKLQVVRVHRLRSAPSLGSQESIVRGISIRDDGSAAIAWAHTFFLPPISHLDEPMFCDFRSIALIPRDHVSAITRIATLTHDARLSFIRRKVYWEQRWPFDSSTVLELEAARISNDVNFEGPRPMWAPSVGD